MAASADELRAWAASAWPAYDWARADVVSGAFHDVVVCEPHVVARLAAGSGHLQRVEREAAAARTVAMLELPLAVPRPIGGPVSRSARSGQLATFLPGRVMPTVGWPDVREALATVLAAFGRVAAEECTALPAPRAWCGADGWLDVVQGRLLRHLAPQVRQTAVQVASDVLAVEDGARSGFVHGDLGLHNMLWSGDHAVGLVDVDHACWGDPAIDIAPLVGAFGAARVSEIVPADLLERALRHRASLPLQVAAAAELVDNVALRDHALRNFSTRCAERTLYDPDGASPRS